MAEKDFYTVKEAETKFIVDQSVLDYLRLFEIELYLASNQVFKYNVALLYMDGVTLFITQDILVKNVTNRGKGCYWEVTPEKLEKDLKTMSLGKIVRRDIAFILSNYF